MYNFSICVAEMPSAAYPPAEAKTTFSAASKEVSV